MKRLLTIVAAAVLFIAIVFFVILKACSGFVSSFDGERQSKMVLLAGDYYYNKSDKQLWQKEESTNSYKNISGDTVDSLVWNSDHIFGYARNSYFILFVREKKYKIFTNSDSIGKLISKDCQVLQEVPPLSAVYK